MAALSFGGLPLDFQVSGRLDDRRLQFLYYGTVFPLDKFFLMMNVLIHLEEVAYIMLSLFSGD